MTTPEDERAGQPSQPASGQPGESVSDQPVSGQPGQPGQPGEPAPSRPDHAPAPPDEATRVGLPATPPSPPPSGGQPQPGQPPAYGDQQPTYGQPPAYGDQQPTYGQPPAYGQSPPPPPGSQPPVYGGQQPPPPYGYYPPPSARGGPSGIIIGLLALGLVIALAIGALYVLGFGPFADPSPTPAAVDPTTPPIETPTATPETTTPTPELSPTPAAQTPSPQPATPGPLEPTPAPDDPLTRLMAHVPNELRDSCLGLPATDSLAATACAADGGAIIVTYVLFADGQQMQQAYDAYVLEAGIAPDSGSCQTGANWPAEGVYTIEDEPAGRLLCTLATEGPVVYWTDDEINVLTYATGQPGQAARLFEFWQQDAGPLR